MDPDHRVIKGGDCIGQKCMESVVVVGNKTFNSSSSNNGVNIFVTQRRQKARVRFTMVESQGQSSI